VHVSAPLTRFGLLGDVHAEDQRLSRALTELAHANVDAVLAVGDLIDGFGDADRTVALLIEHQVVAIAGNHDRWLLADTMRDLEGATLEISDEPRAWLAALPPTRILDTTRGKLLLCHGVGDDDMAELRPDTRGYGLQCALEGMSAFEGDDLRFAVGGHTHDRMVRALGSGLTFINAGTLSRKRNDAGFGLVDLEAGTVTFWDFSGDDIRRAAVFEL